MFERKLDGWMAPVCRHCGHDKFYLDRARQFRRDYCDCTHLYGYHFTHRKGSPRCTHHPDFELHARVFSGESRKDVLEDIARREKDVLEDIALREQCPF